jgi:hypothetical protein
LLQDLAIGLAQPLKILFELREPGGHGVLVEAFTRRLVGGLA